MTAAAPAPDLTPDAWPAGTLLAQLDQRERGELLGLGTRRSAGSGTALLRQGGSDAHVILLRRGAVKVTCTTVDGHGVLLAIRVAGEMVGEMAALNGRRRSATVTTCGPCTYSVIDLREFRDFLAGHPGATVRVAGMVAERLRWANEFRVEFASYPARVRLARVLLKLAQQYGRRTSSGVVIDVHLTQAELAGICGTAKVTVQKLLYDLRHAGLIRTGYRRIAVVETQRLLVVARLA